MNVSMTPVPDLGPKGDQMIPIGFLDELARTTDKSEVFSVYARWAYRIIRADRSTVAIAEERGLRLIAIEGNQAIRTGKLVPIEQTLIGRVFETHTPEMKQDIASETDLLDLRQLASGGIGSCMDVPIVIGERCFGALAAGYHEVNGCSEDDFVLLQALARCLASYLLLHEQLELLEEAALTDPLTRTFNRRYFDASISKLWEHWTSRTVPFSIAIMDIDHFKAINDSHGHTVGDDILVRVADLLKRNTRSADEVIRMGGEEFCLVLGGARMEHIALVAERIRQSIEAMKIDIGGQVVSVTASFGIASAEEGFETREAMVAKADRALYAAKETGRNRISDTAAPTIPGPTRESMTSREEDWTDRKTP